MKKKIVKNGSMNLLYTLLALHTTFLKAFESGTHLPNMFPRVIGHRGAKSLAPENTLASIKAAHRVGTKFVEVDVMLSSDKVPIIHHDNTVDRCTNGKGYLKELTAAQIFQLDAGSWFSPEFAGEKIPSLSALLSLCQELDLTLNLEIKHAPDRASDPTSQDEQDLEKELAAITCRVVSDFNPAPGTFLFSSFSVHALEVCQRLLPQIPRSFLVTTIPDDWEATVRRLGCVSLNFHDKSASREKVAEVTALMPALVYTVNDPARAAELWSWGVSGVFSDCPQLLLPIAPPPAP